MNKDNIGAYLRISQSDNTDCSNSIINQRKIINNFSKEKGLKNIKFYIDDGYSGSNFQRPGFRMLYKDVITRKIKTVIVKDLSRLGRNYLELGKYLEEFSSYDVRVISINDNIDTENDRKENGLLIPIKNILNDAYIKDISAKIKASLQTKKKRGEFVGAFTCYGYKKDDKDKHKLVIDKEASMIIKKIFQLANLNYSLKDIADKLNNDNILSPLLYKKERLNCNIPSRWENTNSLWNVTSVSRILQNEIYCGTLIQKINNEKIRIENNHPSIIEKDLFLTIQKKYFNSYSSSCTSSYMGSYINNYNGNYTSSCTNNYTSNSKKGNIFSGFLKCARCNKAMIRYAVKDDYIYYCSTYRKSNRKRCQKVRIYNSSLEMLVLNKLKERIDNIENLKKSACVTINEKRWLEELRNSRILFYKKRLKEKSYIKMQLLKDYEKKILTRDEYLFFLNEFSIEISDIEEKLCSLNDVYYYHFIDLFLKYKNVKVVSRELIVDLVESIYVLENETIEVVFKYDDRYKEMSSLY